MIEFCKLSVFHFRTSIVSIATFSKLLASGNARRLSASLPPGALPIVGALGVTHDGGASRQRFESFGDAAWRNLAGTAEGHALVYEGMLAYQLGDKAAGNSSTSGSSSSSSMSSNADRSALSQGSVSLHSSSTGSGNVQVRATLRNFLEVVYESNPRSAATLRGDNDFRSNDEAVSTAAEAEKAMPQGSAVLDLSRCFADPRPPPPHVDTAASASSRPNMMDPVAALGWWVHSGGHGSSSSSGLSSSGMVSGGSGLISGSVGSSNSSSSARAYSPSVWPAIAPSSAETGALAAMLLHAAEFGAVVSDGVPLDVNGFAGLWASAAISEGKEHECAQAPFLFLFFLLPFHFFVPRPPFSIYSSLIDLILHFVCARVFACMVHACSLRLQRP